MKKLLIMTGVAAFALGAFATITLPNGTGFDGETPSYDSYWVVPSDVEAAFTPYESDEALEVRPAYFSGANVNYLGIESASTNAPLTRYIGTEQEYKAIGNGLYLDTLVKFTASTETMGTSDTAAKLAIWAQTSDETPAVTNFVVQAGYVTANGTANKVTSTNYVMTAPANFDFTAWHRLTVKAINDIDSSANTETVGFVVFVDGTALERADPTAIADDGVLTLNTVASKFADAVLPSIIYSGDYKTTLQAVSFSGNGKIDDVSFTDVAPKFAADATVYTVTWGVGIASVSYNNTALVKGAENNLPGDPFDLVVTLESGYELDEPTASTDGCTVAPKEGADNTYTVTGAQAGTAITFTAFQPKASVVVGGDTLTFKTLTEAFEAISEVGGTITLLGDVTVDNGDITTEEDLDVTVTIDLAGNMVVGLKDATVFTAAAGGTLVINDSIGGGEVVVNGDDGLAVLLAGGKVIINGGKFTGGAFDIDPGIYGDPATYLEVYGGMYDVSTWDLDGIAKAAVSDEKEGYVTVGGETPSTTYKVTFVAYDGTEISSDNVAEGETPTAPTAPSRDGYTFAGWTPTIAAVTEDVTYTATYSANTYTVTFYTNSVEYVTATYTYGNAATYTAPDAPVVDGFTFGGWFTDDGTFKTEFEFSADVAGNTQVAYAKLTAEQPPEDEYPSYIPTGDAAAKAKYDSWATYAGVTTAAAAEELEAAYLLNCKPDEVAAAKAAFKFTSITKDGDKWVTPTTTSYNDRDYNGTVTVKRYSDVECTTESETGTFFRATLQ